jgi:hypothetical protein
LKFRLGIVPNRTISASFEWTLGKILPAAS